MTDSRSSRNLFLLASLISSSAFVPTANGLVIPSSGLSRMNKEEPPARHSATTPAEVKVDVEVVRTSRQRHGSTLKDMGGEANELPKWAKEVSTSTLADTSHSDGLDRNLHDGNGRFLPIKIPKPSVQRRPRPYFRTPKKLPTPKILESGITKQPDPLALIKSEILRDFVRSEAQPTSDRSKTIPSTATFHHDADAVKAGWLHIEDAKMTPIKTDTFDSFSPPQQSLPLCGGRVHFLSPPQWFERTGILIVGLLVMFVLAVGLVEIGEFVWRCVFKMRRRNRRGRRGVLWLAGDEKRLSAIQEIDEEE
ncbi:MAG: hypothetical protein Q9160_008334 [Pyrenula sp. 1 TL-2023]